MSILFIASGHDEPSTFTSQEKYIHSLADCITKKDYKIALITPAMNEYEYESSKSFYEFSFQFEGHDIINKVYLNQTKNYKQYIIEISGLPINHSYAQNLIFNISVCNFIAESFTNVKGICTFGLSSALSQVFMRYGNLRSFYKKIRTVHIIDSLNCNPGLKPELIKHLPQKEDVLNIMRLGGSFDLNRAAIICADRVIVGSVSYSYELKSEAREARYCHTVRQFGFKVKGIEKGLEDDILEYKNQIVKHPYTLENIKDKAKNKTYLQQLLNLKVSEEIPLLVSFCKSKSDLEYSLVTATSKSILNVGSQFLICIDGDETAWDLRENKQNNFRIIYTNDSALKIQILCSADIYIYCPPVSPHATDVEFSCKCGTVPIVYSTGGAKDVIKYYDRTTESGNGFSFNTYNSHDMLYTVWDALNMFRNEKHHWNNLMCNAINSDFSIEKNVDSLLRFIL